MSTVMSPSAGLSTMQRNWGIVLLLALAVGAWASKNLPYAQAAFCVLTILALAIWALELLPDSMVATALPVLYIVAQVGPPQRVLGPWTSSVGWTVFGGLVLGSIMMQTGLARRVALGSIRLVGGSFNRLLWGVLLGGSILAPFIPSVMGKAAIITVICVGICDALQLEKGSKESSAVIFAGFISVAAPKLAYLTGGADVTMGMRLVSTALKSTPITWMQYLLHNFLPAMFYSILSLGLMQLVLRPKIAGDIASIVEKQYDTLGPVSTNEKKVSILLGALLLFMVTDKWHGVDVGWILLLVPCLAFLPGMNLMDKPRFEKLPFSAVLFVVGCMTIGAAAMACGMDKALSAAMMPLLKGSEAYTIFMSYITGVALNFLLTPLAAYGSLTVPLVEIANQLGVNPWMATYAYGYGLDQYIFPYEYAILLFFHALGYSKLSHLIQVFGLRMILMGGVLMGIIYPYWKLIM